MKITSAVLLAMGLSLPAFAGFNGPIQTSIALMAGKSMTGVHGQASVAALHFDFSRAFRPHTAVTWGVQPFFIQQPAHFFTRDGHGNENALAPQAFADSAERQAKALRQHDVGAVGQQAP